MQIDSFEFEVENGWGVSVDLGVDFQDTISLEYDVYDYGIKYDRYQTTLNAFFRGDSAHDDAHQLVSILNDKIAAGDIFFINNTFGERIFGPHFVDPAQTVTLVPDIGSPVRQGKRVWTVSFTLQLSDANVNLIAGTASLEDIRVNGYNTGEKSRSALVEGFRPDRNKMWTEDVRRGEAVISTPIMKWDELGLVIKDIVQNVRGSSFKIPKKWKNLHLFKSTVDDQYSFIDPKFSIEMERFNNCRLSLNLNQDISP